ncbi:MAG TPA: hypothetical protein VK623_04695 [Flavobacterium sp.]|nr:hypothetical protein [Flavobacterium sp.]
MEHPKKVINTDSPINTKDVKKTGSTKSLTNDESAKTDPNKVPDKASFSDNRKKNTKDKTRFDGQIGI